VLSYSACREGGTAIITPPAEIDFCTAGQLEIELTVALLRGVTTVIVDMSSTTFCDSAGIGTLARAYGLATDMNTTMCLVVGKSIVRKVLEINGIDQNLKIYDSVAAAEEASAAGTSTVASGMTESSAGGC
jgi:anti-sigma B factor antagonist